jgi:hypothetical protein
MNATILGIDVSKDSLDVHLIIVNKSEHAAFENTPKGHKRLVRWHAKTAPYTIAANSCFFLLTFKTVSEAGGFYGAFQKPVSLVAGESANLW